jgi:tRNA(fMet)-specific endonuclease VapC
LLDTNTVIDAVEARTPALAVRMADCEEGDSAISAVTYGEIAVGSAQGKPPLLAILDTFLTDVPVLPFDRGAALAYSAIPFKRARFDCLIAAHALSLDLTVVTDNEHDFSDVPGLRVENWTA